MAERSKIKADSVQSHQECFVRCCLKKRWLIPLIIIAAMIFLNIIARFSRGFSDFYVTKVFPLISAPLSFVSGILPFSVGEVMIIAAVLLIFIGIPAAVLLFVFKKKRRAAIAKITLLFMLWSVTFVFTAETMNCFIMYQCTPFSEKYFSSKAHTEDELIQLYGILINEANALSEQVSRDENNQFFITCDVDSEAKAAMKKAAKHYPQLKGYYPNAKPILFSYFMSQADLLGIYFPFSLESNYNNDMVRTNLPDTICHEYSHLKGIIQEDEANFIAFIAATGSDNPEFRYSGYISALEYVHNEVVGCGSEKGAELMNMISENVYNDWFRFLPENYWEDNEKKEIISTETVGTFSESAIDTNIKFNGREEGIKAYSRIVDLLLDYYFPAED